MVGNPLSSPAENAVFHTLWEEESQKGFIHLQSYTVAFYAASLPDIW